MLEKIKKHFENLSCKKSKILPKNVILFVMIFFIGIGLVYAFYNNSHSFPILSNKVGNFDVGNGDLGIVIYKQSNNFSATTPEYKRSYGVPNAGYEFNRAECTSTCTTTPNNDCYYTYDEDTNKFTITSSKKVSCKFYFNKTIEADVYIYIAIEDENGDLTYNGKNYREAESIPAYGYEYAGYQCKNDATISYDAETKTFNMSSYTKNECYAYFYKSLEEDININVYVQNDIGSSIYKKVNTIPESKGYVVSTNALYRSECYDENGNVTDGQITYSGGYVTATAKGKQTCNIYLDLYEGAPFINKVTSTSTGTSLTINIDAKQGTNNLNCYKYKINGVTELTDCQTSPSYTFNNLSVCTYYNVTVFAADSQGVHVGYTKTYKTGGC